MSRVWAALAVVVSSLVGFVGAFVVTFFIAFSQGLSGECDGPCFSDWVPFAALGGGAVGALVFRLRRVALHRRTLAQTFFIRQPP